MAKRRKIENYWDDDVFGANPYTLPVSQQRQYLKTIAQRANKRMYRLEGANKENTSYAYRMAKKELNRLNRKRFSYKVKDKDIIKEILLAQAFLTSGSSTITELNEIHAKAWNTLKLRLKGNGLNLEEIGISRDDFYNFLNRKEWKQLAEKYGSEYILEDFVEALTVYNESPEDVLKEYSDIMSLDVIPDAARLRRQGVIKDLSEVNKLRAVFYE